MRARKSHGGLCFERFVDTPINKCAYHVRTYFTLEYYYRERANTFYVLFIHARALRSYHRHRRNDVKKKPQSTYLIRFTCPYVRIIILNDAGCAFV